MSLIFLFRERRMIQNTKNLMKVIFYLSFLCGAFILGLEGCSSKSSSNKKDSPTTTPTGSHSISIFQFGAVTKGFSNGDNSKYEDCNSMTVDSSGNIYCAGSTWGALGETQGGEGDAYVMKLDSSGAVQWVTQLGNTTLGFAGGDNSNYESCNSVAVDGSGNIYCAGSTWGALGEANGGENDAFVIKLDSSGAIEWVTQLGNTTLGFVGGDNSGYEGCDSVAVDGSENVYCAGYTGGALGEANGGEEDAFVMKLDSTSGAIEWVTQLGDTTLGFVGGDNSGYEGCASVAVDGSGNVYCAGYTGGALGEANGGEEDAFVMKLDSSGAIKWVTQLGDTTLGFANGDNSQLDSCNSVTVDSSKNVYCAGYTGGALGEANGGEGDAFVMKLDSTSGDIEWVTQLGDTTLGFVGGDNSGYEGCASVAVDGSGNVYCAGATRGALGEAQGGEDKEGDAFVMKLDSSGTIEWVIQLGDTTLGFAGGDNSQGEACYSIAMDSSGNIYCAGATGGALGEAQGGEGDAFIMKLTPLFLEL